MWQSKPQTIKCTNKEKSYEKFEGVSACFNYPTREPSDFWPLMGLALPLFGIRQLFPLIIKHEKYLKNTSTENKL